MDTNHIPNWARGPKRRFPPLVATLIGALDALDALEDPDTPTFDLLAALIDQDAKRRSASADQLAVLCEWIAWQLPIGTVRQIGVYADEKLTGLDDDMLLGGYTPLENALWSLTAACHARLRCHRETNNATATRIVDALLDVVAIGDQLSTEVFRQEAIARAARIIGGEA